MGPNCSSRARSSPNTLINLGYSLSNVWRRNVDAVKNGRRNSYQLWESEIRDNSTLYMYTIPLPYHYDDIVVITVYEGVEWPHTKLGLNTHNRLLACTCTSMHNGCTCVYYIAMFNSVVFLLSILMFLSTKNTCIHVHVHVHVQTHANLEQLLRTPLPGRQQWSPRSGSAVHGPHSGESVEDRHCLTQYKVSSRIWAGGRGGGKIVIRNSVGGG